MFLASSHSPYPEFAGETVGRENLDIFEQMYNESPSSRDFDSGSLMTSFYTSHNTTIGLRVFAAGLLLGVGGVYETIHNAQVLGSVCGPHDNGAASESISFHFVTAHGPFELTAIMLSAAAGMRLGFALVLTGGLTRRRFRSPGGHAGDAGDGGRDRALSPGGLHRRLYFAVITAL